MKRILSAILILGLLLSIAPTVLIASAETLTGTCGENLTWSLDTETNVVTVSGTGELTEAPWDGEAEYGYSLIIENGVTSIGEYAFESCSMASVVIPGSVTSMGDCIFENCYELKSAVILEGVTSIGNGMFDDCYYLESVSLPSSLEHIGAWAFFDCFAMKSITLPNSVTSIGQSAFGELSRTLSDVYYYGSEAEWNNISVSLDGEERYNNDPLLNATRHYLMEGLRISAASLAVHQDIVVRFAATVPTGLTDPHMTVKAGEQSVTLQPSGEDSQGRLVFEVTTLTPDRMGDNISATLYASKDGTVYENSKPEYSIRQYCLNLMAAYPDDAKLQTLLADMLVYGAQTQRFTGYNADRLVTDGLSLTAATSFEDLTSTAFSRTGTEDANIKWTGVGLVCGSRMSMYFNLSTTAGAATSVEVTINGRKTVYPYEKMATDDPNVCRVLFRGIAATEYGDTVTAVLKNNGVQVGETLTYSVNSYVYSMQHDTEYENLAGLVQAIYNYGASAKAYVDSLGG